MIMLPSLHAAPSHHREQLRRMTSTSTDSRNSSRRHRGRSRSPRRADLPRMRRRSLSPPQNPGFPPDRGEWRSRDNARAPKRDRPEVFQSGAGPRGGVCAVCLGRHEHTFAKCDKTKLWNGSPCGVRKNEQGRLVAPDGLILCFDWQLPKGCGASGHAERHKCSGCGKSDHGAQGCTRAEKA